MNPVIYGNPKDNVATCCRTIARGEQVSAGGWSVFALSEIPIYHKIALTDLPAGSVVYKYGEPIGVASRAIAAGEHVHTQNLESARGRGDRKEDAR